MEETNPNSGWPLRAISLWDMMMMMMIDKMNALSIVYEEESSLKNYCSRIPDSYWVMGPACNGGLSVMAGGGEEIPHLKNLHSHFYM
jgi:hypothetical protein